MASSPNFPTIASKLLPFDSLRREIDRVFADFNQTLPRPLEEADFSPAAELHQNDGAVTLRIELPGVDQKDVEISVADDALEISGEKRSETERKDGDKYVTERSYGSFYRSFTLPFTIDAEKVHAKFDKGVLTVTIIKPATAASKAKKIAITS